MNHRHTVLVSSPYPADLIAKLAQAASVIAPPTGQPLIGYDQVRNHAARLSAIINQGELRVDSALIAEAPSLRIVASASIGVNNLALPAIRARRTWCTNTPGAFAEATADCTLGMMLMLMRRLGEAERFVRANRWQAFTPGSWDGLLLRGKTLGLIGYGRIGRAVERRACAFGMRVIHHTRTWSAEPGWRSREALLAEADVVSLHVPLNADSTAMIDANALARMKPGAWLINLSRGAVIDEPALISALESGRLSGAALDVFAHEPAVPEVLRKMENVVLTPHLGGGSQEGRREAQAQCVENVLRVLRGERPIADCIVVEPEAAAGC
jgi:glyoxylate reductase